MYSKELIQKIHRELPEELLDAIASEKTLEYIESIASKNQLSVEQMHKLSSVLTWKLMGLVNEGDFASKIETELGVSNDLATKITDDISKNILSEIPNEILKKQEEGVKKVSELNSKEEPVVITSQETKEEAMKRLMERQPKQEPQLTINNEQLTKEIYPMIEEGEIVHDVPHAESTIDNKQTTKEPQKATAQIPLNEPLKEEAPTQPSGPKYPDGKDPYREPLI